MLDTKRIKANEKMTERPELFYKENGISKMPKLLKTKMLKVITLTAKNHLKCQKIILRITMVLTNSYRPTGVRHLIPIKTN